MTDNILWWLGAYCTGTNTKIWRSHLFWGLRRAWKCGRGLKLSIAWPTHAHLLMDLQSWNFSLVSGASWTIQTATISTVMSSLIYCEPDFAVMAAVGHIVPHPMVHKSLPWFIGNNPWEDSSPFISHKQRSVIFRNCQWGHCCRLSIVRSFKCCVHC